ncbi:MAG: hypothetical protein WCI22_13120, partial [Actinomycetota bacterium]
VELQYASGFSARVVASWQGGPDPLWDAQLAGSEGVVRADLMPLPTLEFNGDEVALPVYGEPFAQLQHFGYTAQMRALVDDASAHREPLMSAAFGREVLQVVMAAYCSAGRDNSTVALPFTGRRDRTPLQWWHDR